jgi:hypothetical protein
LFQPKVYILNYNYLKFKIYFILSMQELNKSLKNLEKINNQEKIKKRKYLKKKEKIIEEKISHSLLFSYKRQKSQFEYRQRLKKKRKKLKLDLPENFNELYEIEQENIYKKEWKKLTYDMRLNRLYFFLKNKKNELKWNENVYKEKIELLKNALLINQLRNSIEYNIEQGEIIKCYLIEKK